MIAPIVPLTWLVLMLAPPLASGAAEFEADGVRIRVQVRASVYSYEVENLSHDPITRFEIPYTNSYDFIVPEGWESADAGHTFKAWSPTRHRRVHYGQKAHFSFRVTSAGAVLGQVPARVGTASGGTISFNNIWGTVPQPRSYGFAVAGVLLIIFVGHALLLRWSRRRAARTTAD